MTPLEAVILDLYWMTVVAYLFAFFVGFGIGVKDVGNCFATSIAATSLTIFWTVVIATIFEFGEAVLRDTSVTVTIHTKLPKSDYYDNHPEVLVLQTLAVMANVLCWLFMATFYKMPVSTTHTTVAAIIFRK